MSQRSEIYKQLRESSKKLSKINGTQSTLDLMETLNEVWPILVKTRSMLIKSLLDKNVITKEDVTPNDFLNLYLTLHNPKRESRLCEHCVSEVEFGITTCPFCGEHVNGKNTREFLNEVTINFNLSDKRPDWDIDYSAKEILDKNKPLPPMIKPITNTQLGDSPTGMPSFEKRDRLRNGTLPRSARDLLAWAKKRELAQKIPFTATQLQKMNKGELMCLCSLFKTQTDLDWLTLSSQPLDEMRRFILGHQGAEPIDVGAPPIGKLPDLAEILQESGEEDKK